MKLSNKIGVCAVLIAGVFGLRADSWQMTTRSIAAGQTQALALRSDGSLWSWGNNQYGELGVGNVANSSFPVRISGVSNVVSMAAGWNHSLAVDASGAVWTWGLNNIGQLGNGTQNNSLVPVQASGITNAIAVAGGHYHSLALLSNGTVLGWGVNTNGELGYGTNVISYGYTLPVFVPGLSNIVKIVAGEFHSLALDKSGTVWAWGSDSYGQLGNGIFTNISPSPTAVFSNALDIAAGADHTIALKSDRSVWAWGYNGDGELGLGNQTTLNVPTQITSLSGVQVIGAGQYCSGATLTNGQNMVWGWQNETLGTINYFNTPTALDPAPPFTQYAFGVTGINNFYYTSGLSFGFSLGMTASGSVWAWGDNSAGQFGNGNIMAPPNGDFQIIPTQSFAPTPPARWGEFVRGNTFDDLAGVTGYNFYGTNLYNNLNFCSIVVPTDMEQGVALNATGADAYCYSNSAPWFLCISNQTLYQRIDQNTYDVNTNIIPVNNPVVAFGAQGGGSALYPNQPYRFAVYAGGFYEAVDAATNVIRISVYSASNFIAGATNVSPVNIFTIPMPRRTINADSNRWTVFMSNGASVTFTTNGLTTTVQFMDTGSADNLPFGLSWMSGVVPNYILTAYQLTHVAATTNYYYKVEVLGAEQTLTTFTCDAVGNWVPTPLYTMDFALPASNHSAYLDRLFFQGTPMPPSYTEASLTGQAGMNVGVTNQYVLTNSIVYRNLDGSPELRRHPLLDQLVLDLNKDPLALASYVINQIELVDPYAVGNASLTVQPQITCGGIDRSALGTYLEGQGSPIEQCALLVYLLRQAGYSAAYAFPTNNNIFMSASHISQLFEMQVNGVLYPNGIPYITNSLLSVNYPWVVANIGTNTVNIFPWIKDHEIVEGVNFYDYMPSNYNNGLAWVKQYCRGNTNILNLSSNNVVASLLPAFIQQYLNPLGTSYSLDNLGVRAFNRQHQFPSWSYLPQPDAVTNLNTVAIVDKLGNSAGFTFLTNVFNQAQVQVCDPGGFAVLDSGSWNACELNDRKFLLFNDNNRISLWLAPYRAGITTIQSFTGPSSIALQSNSIAYGAVLTNTGSVFTNGLLLTVNTIHKRQINTLQSSPEYVNLPLNELTSVINVSHCNVGDVTAFAFDFGRVTPLMLQQHEETYWNLQRQIATNSSYIPKVWDYSGTAAYLMGMGYFQKLDAFDANLQQWHKLHSLIRFSSGLGVIGATGSTNLMQAKTDMFCGFELYMGNSSLNMNYGQNTLVATPAWQNYFDLLISAVSSQEHDIIQSYFPDQNAISTVRLLQIAQQRATNGNSPIIELYNNNYIAVGNQTNAGYGTNLLKNVDAVTWAKVNNLFNQGCGAYACVLITPGNITNSTKSYVGMGALLLSEANVNASISLNSATLNGGCGGEQAYLSTTYYSSSGNYGLTYNLNDSGSGNLSFSVNTPSIGDVVSYMFSLQDVANLSSGTSTYNYTPQQINQATQTGIGLGQTGGTTSTGIRANADSGFWSGSKFLSAAGTMAYDPVNIYSGEFYVDAVDLSLPGPFPLQLRRNYTSQTLQANQMGYGWKMNFNPYLCQASNLIYAAELDGTTLAYRSTNGVWKVLAQDNPTLNNNSTRGIGSTANLFNSVLTMTNVTNYVINAPDGSVRTYQTMSFPIVSSTNVLNRTRPYLVTWADDAGNSALFFYGTNSMADDWGQLNRINMTNGNTLVFKYDFYGRLIQAIAGDGRFVNYQYDTYGDLTAVTLPDLSQCQYQYQHYTYTSTNGTNHADSYHLISQEITPNGRVLANNYDAMRRVVTQASTVGTNLMLVTNAYFYYTNNINTNNYLTNQYVSGITRVEDVFHNPTLYYYTNNLITNTVDPLGGTNLAVWFLDSQTNLTGYYPRSLQYSVDKRGLTNQFYYDSFGNVTQSVYSGNLTGEGLVSQTATNTTSYTNNNLPFIVRDPSGNGIQYSYDGADQFRPLQAVLMTGSTPVVTNYFYYTNVTQVSSLGVTNQAFGLRWRIVNGGATNDNVFNGNGFPVQTKQYPATTDTPDTDPAVVHNLTYNQRGQLVQDQIVGGGLSQFDYDPMGRMISRQSFDQVGNTLSQEFFYYNRNGQLEWYDGPRANPQDYVNFVYDGAGRVIQQIKARSQAKSDGSGVESPAGNNQYATTFQTFDGFGNLTSVIDPRGALTGYSYDALGRMTKRLSFDLNGSALKTNQFAYEKGGLMASVTNGLGGVSRVLYTSTGKPYYLSTPDGATNGVTYYLDGRIKRQIQGNGAYWQTTYDDVNLITTRVFYTSTGTALATNSVQTDKRGNVIRKTDAAGNAFTTQFDCLDRVKVSAGPAIVTVTATGGGPGIGGSGGSTTYTTNILQHCITNSFDAAGLTLTTANALGESSVSQFDAIGRIISGKVYSAIGTLVRERYWSYSADHNAVTVTDGSGGGAISGTTWTDNDGNTVLSIANPAPGVSEFTLNQFDLSGNLVSTRHNSSANGAITTWTTTALAYDGLNRLTQKVDRDGATNVYAYDSMDNLITQTMPGGALQWIGSYVNSGLIVQEYNSSGGAGTRTNVYSYFGAGSPFAGLLQTKTDGRGVVGTYAYDAWLCPTNLAYSGSFNEQSLTASWQYEARGYVTNLTEAFNSTNTGPATTIARSFDAYGQLATESVNAGAFGYSSGQGFDAAGRRNQLNIGGNNYGFGWQADGALTYAGNPTGSGAYSYTSSGLLSTRTVGSRVTTISTVDGEGRPLGINTSVGGTTALSEVLTWTGDGLLSTHTLNRDYLDSRVYTYANASRRLVQEQLNLNNSTIWTNSFVYDKSVAAGPGVLTQMGKAGQSSGLWSGRADAFSRVNSETNNTISYPANGHVNGQAAISAWLDSGPVSVTATGTNAMQWRTMMELSSGTHQLKVAAVHPGGFYTAWATNSFTNNISYQTTTNAFDGAGNVTLRLWRNASGTTNRIQTLTWDGRGRLHSVTERDGSNNGQNFTVVYDAVGRRLQTTQVLVTNGVALTNIPVVVCHYFDPLYEFQELGVIENSQTTLKLMGPDQNGTYGGENGTGGFEGFSPYLNTFNPTLADFNGNVLGCVSNTTVVWNNSRATAYGSAPNYRPAPLGRTATLDFKCGYRNRATESIGLVWLGANWYDPIDGKFMSPDPLGHSANPTLYDVSGGNPLGYFDADGRFGKSAMQQIIVPTSLSMAIGMANQGLADYQMGGGGTMGTLTAVNRYNPFTPFYNLAGQRDILSGKQFSWWGDYSENIGQAGLSLWGAGLGAKTLMAGQFERFAARFGSFSPGEMMPNGQMAGIGPGSQFVGETTIAKSAPGKYSVGIYDDIRGTVQGMDAHHVGQKAVMEELIPGYDPANAPSILVPKVGHTRIGLNGIVSRSTEGFTSARDVIARDIRELRRVYPDVPNSKLQELIQMNKDMYPSINK